MSVPQRVVHKRRETITALPLYYCGHLLKKGRKEKDFKKYYGELRGATLFLYTNDTQDTYTEKLDLEELKSMELDSPYKNKMATIFTLALKTEEVQLKMDNPDRGEEWRGYILTVIRKAVPSKLQLLPGQMLQLQEVLAQEKRRNSPMSRPPLPPRPSFLLLDSPTSSASSSSSSSSCSTSSSSCSSSSSTDEPDNAPDVPVCFFNVTRQEAEEMLEANPECGGIILRPSTLAKNYAVTLRQQTHSGPVMKNYRVSSTDSGFAIELDTPVNVSTLQEVLEVFLEKTEYRVHPYSPSQPYDTVIAEVSPAPVSISINSPTPRILPRAQVAPMLRSKIKELLPFPDKPVGGEYIIPEYQSPDATGPKLVHLDRELREVLKMRRNTINAAAEEDQVYENQTSNNSHSGTAQWTTDTVIM